MGSEMCIRDRWWRPTAATFVVAIVAMNRVDVVDLVVDLVDVNLDVDLVDVDLDVDLIDVDCVDVDFDVVPFCGCCPAGGLDLEKNIILCFINFSSSCKTRSFGQI